MATKPPTSISPQFHPGHPMAFSVYIFATLHLAPASQDADFILGTVHGHGAGEDRAGGVRQTAPLLGLAGTGEAGKDRVAEKVGRDLIFSTHDFETFSHFHEYLEGLSRQCELKILKIAAHLLCCWLVTALTGAILPNSFDSCPRSPSYKPTYLTMGQHLVQSKKKKSLQSKSQPLSMDG